MLTFELVTLEGVKFSEECYEVVLPTVEGQIGIFPDHAPLIAAAVPGVISIRKRQSDPDDKLDHFATDGGLVEINGRHVRLLADTAEHADDINEMEAKAALQRAKELKSTAKDQVAVADAVSLIERHTARLKVADIKRRRRRTR